jgi:integrase
VQRQRATWRTGPGSTTTNFCATTCSPPSARCRCPPSRRPKCGRGTPHSASTPGPTARAHAYALLRTVMNIAVADDLIPANPCRVRGAGQTRRVKKIVPATLAELAALTKAMPGKYQLLVLLAAWCGLQFGELAELRRSDTDVTNGLIHVRRGVVRISTGPKVKDPRCGAGRGTGGRRVRLCCGRGRTRGRGWRGRVVRRACPSRPIAVYSRMWSSTTGEQLRRKGDGALTSVALGAVLAASTEATLAELMARLGHSTPGAAVRYQHAAQDCDRVIGVALSNSSPGA